MNSANPTFLNLGGMMKKPEKKNGTYLNQYGIGIKDGYNQAIEDYEQWLPNATELSYIIQQVYGYDECPYADKDNIAKAIAERLGK